MDVKMNLNDLLDKVMAMAETNGELIQKVEFLEACLDEQEEYIAELEAEKESLEEAKVDSAKYKNYWLDAIAERDRLKSENEMLRRELAQLHGLEEPECGCQD